MVRPAAGAAALVDGAAMAEQRRHAGLATALASPSPSRRCLSLRPSSLRGRPMGDGRAGMVRPAAEALQRRWRAGRYAVPAMAHCGGLAAAPWLRFPALALHREDEAEDQCLTCHLRGRF
ncbi:hypothetical protein U9M48_009458 [Paspalum notatum var. saurae]|uniref:Uncharacterized protein n=1 Tax=Paspalum notatum var. saurae TaxID=547442 RepID=A0AAQ3SRV5_PASNO